MLANDSHTICLLSHKCNADVHPRPGDSSLNAFGRRLQSVFDMNGVALVVDPFGPGDDIDVRIQTFVFHAVLFLCTPESLCSRACRQELDTARSRNVPIFTILLRGASEGLGDLNQRIHIDMSRTSPAHLDGQLGKLAMSVRWRGTVWRHLLMLSPEAAPEEMRAASLGIADMAIEHPEVVAEFIDDLGARYSRRIDPTARFWMATAIGATGTRRAGELLTQLAGSEDHPYPASGIQQGLDRITRRSSLN